MRRRALQWLRYLVVVLAAVVCASPAARASSPASSRQLVCQAIEQRRGRQRSSQRLFRTLAVDRKPLPQFGDQPGRGAGDRPIHAADGSPARARRSVGPAQGNHRSRSSSRRAEGALRESRSCGRRLQCRRRAGCRMAAGEGNEPARRDAGICGRYHGPANRRLGCAGCKLGGGYLRYRVVGLRLHECRR